MILGTQLVEYFLI